jgi:hypothetical protein
MLSSDPRMCGSSLNLSPASDGGTMASIKCGPGVDNACSNACTKSSVSAARTACDLRLETIKVNATGRLQAEI